MYVHASVALKKLSKSFPLKLTLIFVRKCFVFMYISVSVFNFIVFFFCRIAALNVHTFIHSIGGTASSLFLHILSKTKWLEFTWYQWVPPSFAPSEGKCE